MNGKRGETNGGLKVKAAFDRSHACFLVLIELATRFDASNSLIIWMIFLS